MSKREGMPVVVTIGGSDSGGGAGVQADLKTFLALGVHGTSVVTCVTAQNPLRVISVEPLPPRTVRAQLDAIFSAFEPRACKVGMLYSAAILREVAGFFQSVKPRFLVVDPLLISTSGAPLLQPDAMRSLRRLLLPMADLITPNLAEAEWLSGRNIRNQSDMRAAAERLFSDLGSPVLIKGGHLPDRTKAHDIYRDRDRELILSAPYVRGVSTHGTGCTYSAAIAANYALGHSLPNALALAKKFITRAISRSRRVGAHRVLAW